MNMNYDLLGYGISKPWYCNKSYLQANNIHHKMRMNLHGYQTCYIFLFKCIYVFIF